MRGQKPRNSLWWEHCYLRFCLSCNSYHYNNCRYIYLRRMSQI